jgi:paraquat-inducible protein B
MHLGPGAVPGTAAKGRPLTQQGLGGVSGIKAPGTASGRQIQDGHYFFGKLSQKLSQVSKANDELRQQIEQLDGSRAQVNAVNERLEEVTSDVLDLERQLQGHNLIVQKATSLTSKADVESAADRVMVCSMAFLSSSDMLIRHCLPTSCMQHTFGTGWDQALTAYSHAG